MSEKTKVDLLLYFAEAYQNQADIPSIPKLSKELGLSVSGIREQLELARAMGFVDVKPKLGIQCQDFDLSTALVLAMRYGIKVKPDLFEAFSDLRKHIESSYWYEAVPLLTDLDISELEKLVQSALQKVHAQPMQVPLAEHRALHLTIFKRLNNPVVLSILETYWALYKDADINYYLDRSYLETVWNYHKQMVEALAHREFEKGYIALITHMDLFRNRQKAEISQRFE